MYSWSTFDYQSTTANCRTRNLTAFIYTAKRVSFHVAQTCKGIDLHIHASHIRMGYCLVPINTHAAAAVKVIQYQFSYT
jgi:hypothetical protein